MRALLGLLIFLLPQASMAAGPLEFELTYPAKKLAGPFTGRVYVLLTKGSPRGLMSGPDWFNPEPFFAMDVVGWRAEEKLVLGAGAMGFPVAMKDVSDGKYTVQAVMDLNLGGRSFSASPGNLYSVLPPVQLSGREGGKISLTLDQVWEERPTPMVPGVRFVQVKSKLLSDFYKRDVFMRAGVVLPTTYEQNPDRIFPVVYEIPGFGGNHFGAAGRVGGPYTKLGETDAAWVVLDPDCPNGHHVFADSQNNGPCGRALTEELIPELEKQFRVGRGRGTRLVTGHSSGGWSSLWLQVRYPDVFGGVWSTAPDPVDFRDFQRIDLSAPMANLFFDQAGKARELSRARNGKALTFRDFSRMEEVMGRGGQLGSFEAVFSQRGTDGKPIKLWDRGNGAIDLRTSQSWVPYDIVRRLDENWQELEPKLNGRLFVYCGTADTFYLDGAVILLREALEKRKAKAVVEMIPGADHGSFMTRAFREKMSRQMEQVLRANREGAKP